MGVECPQRACFSEFRGVNRHVNIDGAPVTHPRRISRGRLAQHRISNRAPSTRAAQTPVPDSSTPTSPDQVSVTTDKLESHATTRRPHPDITRPRNGSDPTAASESANAHSRAPVEPLLFTAEQAAALLQVRPSWLRRKAAARAVPCRFVGKHLRFSRADLEAIAEESATPLQ